MAIEIIPKPKIKKGPPVNVFFYVLSVLFLVFLASFFILYFSQKKLSQELSDIESSLQISPEERSLEEELLSEQKKINDFGLLFSRHQFTASLFAHLEKFTQPKVSYSRLKLSLEKNLLELSGQTESFEILGQQILIFKSQGFIKNLYLAGVSIGKEGKINFDLQLTPDPRIFSPR